MEVTARLVTLHKKDGAGELIGVDDNAFCIYRLSGGATGTMTASWTHYGAEDNSTVLHGTKGMMKIYDDPVHSIVVVKEDGTRKEYDAEAMQTNDNQTNSGVIDLFIECQESGREPNFRGVCFAGNAGCVRKRRVLAKGAYSYCKPGRAGRHGRSLRPEHGGVYENRIYYFYSGGLCI